MQATQAFEAMQVHGWEPTQGVEDTDVGTTLGELPAGFCVARHFGDEMMSHNMAAPRRLAPSLVGSTTASAYAPPMFRLRMDDSSSSASSQSGTSPNACFESPPPAFHLPTPPQTRSPSLVPSPPSTRAGTGARAATSSRSPAAAGVLRRTRTSTERKFERKRAENANYIPRPKNSFILFRTEFVARHKRAGEAFGATASAAAAATTAALLAAERRVKNEGYDFGGVGDGDELEGASLSKQASEVWNRMNDTEKQPWVDLADKEKEEHARRYPNYRYRPVRSNSATGMPTDHASVAASQQRTGKSASPGARSTRQSSPLALTRSKSAREESKPVSEEERAKEEAQKRRCALIHDLMAQGYRGGELTNALLMLEGGVLPPGPPLAALAQEGEPPTVRSLPAASIQASISSSMEPNTASSSQITSVAQLEAPLTRTMFANKLSGVPTVIMPTVMNSGPIRMLSSSSSLARALIPKTPSPPALPSVPPIPSFPRVSASGEALGAIPRSPSAPVFDTRSMEGKGSAKTGSPATSTSCPSTPHPYIRSMDLDEKERDSPCSSFSTLPTHSVPPSPDVERSVEHFASQSQIQPAGPAADSSGGYLAYENSQNDYVPMNEFYEHYDSNASLTFPLGAEQPGASFSSVSASTASVSQHDRQRPLDAVAAIWSSHTHTHSQSSSSMHCTASYDTSEQPRPSWASPRDGASPVTLTAPPTATDALSVNEEQMRALTGLPSPPTASSDLKATQPPVLHAAPSLGGAASQSTDVDIEAYQLGLGNVLSSSSSSSAAESDCSFMFVESAHSGSCFEFFGLDLVTGALPEPEPALAYSALGLYSGNPDNFSLDSLFELPGADQKDTAGGGGFAKSLYDDDYARYIRTP